MGPKKPTGAGDKKPAEKKTAEKKDGAPEAKKKPAQPAPPKAAEKKPAQPAKTPAKPAKAGGGAKKGPEKTGGKTNFGKPLKPGQKTALQKKIRKEPPKPTPKAAFSLKLKKGEKDILRKAQGRVKPGQKPEKKAEGADKKKTATPVPKKATTPKSVKSAVAKALRIKKKALKGGHPSKTRKVRTTVRFRRPKTFRAPRHPKYPRKSTARRSRMEPYLIIKYPLTSEAAMKKIEDNNTLVFIVHIQANKHHIKQAVKKLYDIDVAKVNTLIKPDGRKKAYVKLAPECDALDVANKIGII